MHPSIRGLGRFIRRTANPRAVAAIYAEGLGLPVIVDDDAIHIAAGEGHVLVIAPGTPRGVPSGFAFEPSTPVFRTHAIDATLDRLVAAGATIVEEPDHPDSRVVYFRDSDNNLFGIQERYASSPRPEDADMRRRWHGPGAVQHLGWIVSPVADKFAMTAFYRDVVGMDVIEQGSTGGARLAFGDGSVLITMDDGVARPASANAPDSWLIRVDDARRAYDRLTAGGVQSVRPPVAAEGGWQAWLADPEGNLFGIIDGPED